MPHHIPPTVLQLDQPCSLAFTQLARYRMGTVEPRPFTLHDLSDRRRSYAALVAWLWACLTPEHHAAYPTPEALVPQITPERAAAAMQALGAAVAAAHPPEKNGDGSTRRPSPASSSGSAARSSGR